MKQIDYRLRCPIGSSLYDKLDARIWTQLYNEIWNRFYSEAYKQLYEELRHEPKGH